MSNTCEGLDTCNISPVRPKKKHTSTPMRTRRKLSRRDQGVDVHTTTCSTPTAAHRSPRLQRQFSPRVPSASVSSPSESIPCSQDNHCDVVWDFTSPKLPKGSRKNEFKITVQDLLENLNQCQASESNTKAAPYVKLLENWMSKPTVQTTMKKIENNKIDHKKRSRHRIEELRKFMESMQKPKMDTEPESNIRCHETSENKQDAGGGNTSKSNTSFKNSFLEDGSTDDSSEELWGDIDNSFMVKATQELDRATVTITSNQMEEIVSTIPNTLVPKSTPPVIEQDKHLCHQYSDLLLHLSNVDWDLDGDDDWDNGFLIEDDDLSHIPEDVLSGENITQVSKENKPISGVQVPEKTLASDNISNDEDLGIILEDSQNVFCLGETELSVAVQDVPNAELYNSFEDESFEDESLLCQPEVLSRIEEVESMLSQPKCTPEEIKKKKDEAIKRRKNTRSKKT